MNWHCESVETEAPAPEIETVRSDISDGERNVKIRRIKGTKPVFFKAKLAIDADGAARAYHPDKQNPESLDDIGNANSFSKKFIQGKSKNGKPAKAPVPASSFQRPACKRGQDFDADAFVDAEFIPYIVLPAHLAEGISPGDLCTVVNLKNFRTTSAIFADTNPHVGEASVRAAINLHVKDPSFPITKLARAGGDEAANYVYIVYPGSRFTPNASVPHWPADKIDARQRRCLKPGAGSTW